MKKLLFFLGFLILAGAVFFFVSKNKNTSVPTSQNQSSEKPTISPSPIKENIYDDIYFDFSFTYPTDWTVKTKMSKNRPCEMAKTFLRTPNCSTEDLTTETLLINSSEKDINNQSYGITIETATDGLGFACVDNIEKNYSVTVKGQMYQFDACQDAKSGEEWGMAEMAVTGPKSEWKAILVNFSAKNEIMTKAILQILQSIK